MVRTCIALRGHRITGGTHDGYGLPCNRGTRVLCCLRDLHSSLYIETSSGACLGQAQRATGKSLMCCSRRSKGWRDFC
eukprot:47853-Eustigmatos_ZCMA.PRE.1